MMDAWQDISTAPRDGTEVLCGHAGTPGVAILYWLDGGWRDADTSLIDWSPTHWMHLPSPPPELAP